MWNRKSRGDTPGLSDSKIRRQKESIVEQEERRRLSRAKRQEDQKEERFVERGTAREQEILQS